MRLSAGTSSSARCNMGRPRHEFRAVLGQRRKGRALPVRPPGRARARAHRAARAHRRRLARLSPRRRARPALRLSRARAVRAGARPPLQRQQAADRSLRQARSPGALVWSDAHFGYRTGSARADLSFDRRDNARGMPKAVVVDEAFTWGARAAPRHPLGRHDHLRGPRQGTDPEARRRAAGLARHVSAALPAPAMIDHLKRLGVTAVELLPIHGFDRRPHLVEHGLDNYWGYNTLGFFAPEARYARRQSARSFRSTVARLHDAGIEVILDVVYNHTAEGNQLGPTLSFRGIDNASYYWLKPDKPRFYDDFTGCGNCAQPDPSARAADGDGFAALLGRGMPCRRLPLRSRHHARRAGRTGSTATLPSSPRSGRTRCWPA